MSSRKSKSRAEIEPEPEVYGPKIYFFNGHTHKYFKADNIESIRALNLNFVLPEGEDYERTSVATGGANKIEICPKSVTSQFLNLFEPWE